MTWPSSSVAWRTYSVCIYSYRMQSIFLLCIIDLVYGNFTLSVTENTWSVSNLVIINTEVFHVHKMYRSILMSGVGLQFPVLFFS